MKTLVTQDRLPEEPGLKAELSTGVWMKTWAQTGGAEAHRDATEVTSAKGGLTGQSQESLTEWFMHKESFINGAKINTEILKGLP